MLPFQGALNFFLGVFQLLPQPMLSFISVCLGFFLVAGVIRLVVAHL